MTTTVYAVKFRSVGEKKFSFLTSTGGSNYLKVHAARFYDEAKVNEFVDGLKADPENKDFEFKVVTL
jgi:hypothetical protein